MAKLSFKERVAKLFGENWLTLDLKDFNWQVTRGQTVRGVIVLKSEKLRLPIGEVKITGWGFRDTEVERSSDDDQDDVAEGGMEVQDNVCWELDLTEAPPKPEIEPGETMEIPFEFEMPADIPPSSDNVRYEMEFEVATKGINPSWYDDIIVK